MYMYMYIKCICGHVILHDKEQILASIYTNIAGIDDMVCVDDIPMVYNARGVERVEIIRVGYIKEAVRFRWIMKNGFISRRLHVLF